MNLKVFNEESTVDKEVFLKLKKREDGRGVDLLAVDSQGNRISSLLLIRNDGTFDRYTHVSSYLGFLLDDSREGRVLLVDT